MSKDMILSLEENTIGTDYLVGDIHGEFQQLSFQLEEIGFNLSTDRLICSGDLVNRGEQSHKVLEWLDKPWFYSARGNHDSWIMDFLNASVRDLGHLLLS